MSLYRKVFNESDNDSNDNEELHMWEETKKTELSIFNELNMENSLKKIWDYVVVSAHNKNWSYEKRYLSKIQVKDGIVFTVNDKEWNEKMIFYKNWQIIDNYNGETIKKIRWNHIVTIDKEWNEKKWIMQCNGTMISGIDWWRSAEDESSHWFHEVHTIEIWKCESIQDSHKVKTYPVYHKESLNKIENIDSYIPEISTEKLDGSFDTTTWLSDLTNRIIISEKSYDFRDDIKPKSLIKWNDWENIILDLEKEREILEEKKELVRPVW